MNGRRRGGGRHALGNTAPPPLPLSRLQVPFPPLQPAIFPPPFQELPPPPLELFDLDQEFATPLVRPGPGSQAGCVGWVGQASCGASRPQAGRAQRSVSWHKLLRWLAGWLTGLDWDWLLLTCRLLRLPSRGALLPLATRLCLDRYASPHPSGAVSMPGFYQGRLCDARGRCMYALSLPV